MAEKGKTGDGPKPKGKGEHRKEEAQRGNTDSHPEAEGDARDKRTWLGRMERRQIEWAKKKINSTPLKGGCLWINTIER